MGGSRSSGPYFVWFWAFANDTEGAGKYLEILKKYGDDPGAIKADVAAKMNGK